MRTAVTNAVPRQPKTPVRSQKECRGKVRYHVQKTWASEDQTERRGRHTPWVSVGPYDTTQAAWTRNQ